MADDLQRFLDNQPIAARRPSALDRLVKWGRRHKPLVVAGVLSLVLLSLGLLATTIVIAREHAKTKLAYQRVVEERAAANLSFQQARQAVDTFTLLGEEELISKPSMYQLRRKFLETSLDYYETFLEQHRNDKAVQAELDNTRRWVAKIIDELTALSSFGPLMLLSDERVQEELGVDDAQQEKIEKLIDRLWSQRAETNDQQLTREERQHQLAESLRSHEEQIARVVGPRQMERLRQIALQQQGPFAFKRQEVIEALELSSDHANASSTLSRLMPRTGAVTNFAIIHSPGMDRLIGTGALPRNLVVAISALMIGARAHDLMQGLKQSFRMMGA